MRYGIRSALIMITAAMLLGSGPALAQSAACKADLNGDLVVNFGDLAVLKSVFFQRCNDPGPRCGDGVAQGPTEECDDGNLANGDGCSATCTIEGPLPLVCGDGLAVTPEQCDDHNLVGGDGCSSTCMLEPASHFPATGQTTCWDAAGTVIPSCMACWFVGGRIQCGLNGHDGAIQAGATLAYVDNGNGTITDANTGLMWEKLSDDGTIHDWNNPYIWDNAFAVKARDAQRGQRLRGTSRLATPEQQGVV